MGFAFLAAICAPLVVFVKRFNRFSVVEVVWGVLAGTCALLAVILYYALSGGVSYMRITSGDPKVTLAAEYTDMSTGFWSSVAVATLALLQIGGAVAVHRIANHTSLVDGGGAGEAQPLNPDGGGSSAGVV
eukprot:GHVU01161352.1.p1 GENE.GHVU01161352.1~~GHVU01161352.1.p1  ORF type:complete len:131 (+),score=17.53 GHVU01161352.1:696-1088(+)